MLSVHFKFPAPLQWKAAGQPLEVVLVNAKTREKPSKADILAQANLDRGGNVDEQRRVQQLEVQQQRLLAQAQESPSRVPVEDPRAEHADQPTPHPGRDLADLSLAAMRLQAQIDKQIEEYQKRPRKKF